MRKKHSLSPIPLDLEFDPIIGRDMQPLGLEKEIPHQQWIEEWMEVVGPKIAQHTRPISFEDGILTIRVKDRHWLMELSSHRASYARLINEQLGEQRIKEFRFEIGEFTPLPENMPIEDNPSPAWLDLQLPPEVEEEIEQKLAHLPENHIKQSARRIMLNHRKVLHMRQRHKRPRR